MAKSRLHHIIVAVLCSIAMTSSYPGATPPAKIFPICTPANCYSATVCTNINEIARVAQFLQQALETELRYRNGSVLQQPVPNGNFKEHSPHACNVTLFEWIRYRKELNTLLNEAEAGNSQSCDLQLYSEASVCTSLLKKFKCAASRIRFAYSSKETCLIHKKHQAWSRVVESTKKLMELVEPRNSSDLHQDSHWTYITTATKSMKNILDYLAIVSNDTLAELAEAIQKRPHETSSSSQNVRKKRWLDLPSFNDYATSLERQDPEDSGKVVLKTTWLG